MVGGDRYVSFADAGVIEQYHLDFLTLKGGGRTQAAAELSL
jgi:hypothetical protein